MTPDNKPAAPRLPKFITFTGADAHTDIHRMEALSKRYPIEWGILFSPKRQGEGRYPPMRVANQFANSGALQLSAHLCGGFAREALAGNWPLPMGGFSRVQINTTEPNIDTLSVYGWAARKGIRAILQCRGEFPADKNVDWLFDQSGGRGVSPSKWPDYAGKLVGYAGGIGPDNVLDVLSKIDATDFWIDMESKVRDEADRFDLDKVERVCELVYGRAALSHPVPSAPEPSQKYDDTLLPFLALMRRELHANSRKGDRPGWLTMSREVGLLEIYWHTAKLSAAVKNNDAAAISEHCADVANMAMMLLDVCGGIETSQMGVANGK